MATMQTFENNLAVLERIILSAKNKKWIFITPFTLEALKRHTDFFSLREKWKFSVPSGSKGVIGLLQQLVT